MAAESPGWLNIITTTIANYSRVIENNILRERILLALMEQKGRITYNHGGTKFDRKIRYRRNNLVPYASDDTITFARRDRFKPSQLPNDRGYVLPEGLGEIDTLQNKGQEAIVKMWENIANWMEEDGRENFCDKLYIDGYATGNYGGSWSNGVYPVGSTTTPEYDFWSPILVDYTSPVAGAYSASDPVWQNTCIEAIRNLITYCRRQKSTKGMLDLLLIELDLFKQYKQIPVLSGQAQAMRSLGFDVIEVDGLMISTEFGIPSGVGYGFNTNMMELKSLRPVLFDSVGPIYNEDSNSYRWLMKMTGNLELNPRFMGKLKNYSLAAA